MLDAQALGRGLVSRRAFLTREGNRRRSSRSEEECKDSKGEVGDPADEQEQEQQVEGAAPLWRVFAAYERQRIPRAARTLLRSRAAARVLHDPAALRPGNVTRASVAEGG